MSKYAAPALNTLAEFNEQDLEDTEASNSWLPIKSFAYPGAQYFNEIMPEKTIGKGSKFKLARKLSE